MPTAMMWNKSQQTLLAFLESTGWEERGFRKASNTNKLFSISRSRNTDTGKQNTQVKVHMTVSLFDHEPPHTDQATSHLHFATSLLEAVKDLRLFKARDSTSCFLTMLANCHMLYSTRRHCQTPLSSWLLCYPETSAHR